jgi:hypothetical protein
MLGGCDFVLELDTARLLPEVEYRSMLHQDVHRHAAVSAGLLSRWSQQRGPTRMDTEQYTTRTEVFGVK